MNATRCVLYIVLNLLIGVFAQQCHLVNWLDHQSSIQSARNSRKMESFFRTLFSNLGNTVIHKRSKPLRYDYSVFRHDFNLKYRFTRFNVSGIERLHMIKPIQVLSPNRWRLNISIDQNMHIQFGTVLNFTQETQSGCASNEERHGWMCYQRCALLTNGQYPVRVSAFECASTSSSPSKPEIRHHKGIVPCMGYAVSGKVRAEGWKKACPRPFYRFCAAPGNSWFFKKKGACKPFTTSPTVELNISRPSIQLDMEFNLSLGHRQEDHVDVLFNELLETFSLGVMDDAAQLSPTQQALLQQVTGLKIFNVRVEQEKVHAFRVDYFKPGYFGVAVEYPMDFVKWNLNRDNRLRDQLMRSISSITKEILNSKIESKLDTYFGQCSSSPVISTASV